jgi:hypothetical protein
MLRKILVTLLCLSVFQPLLGSCDNPENPVIQENWEKPGDKTPAGESSDSAQSAKDNQDKAKGSEGSGSETEQEGEAGSGNQPDSGGNPGSGDTPGTGGGQGGATEPGSGNQPGTGGSPGSGDTPGTGGGQGGATEPGSENQPGTGGSSGSGQESRDVTGVAALQAYLEGQAENTAENPYPVKVGGINLASTGAKDTLKGLYAALSRYVALDLSGSYGEKFANITPATAPNKEKITAIILPSGLSSIEVNAFVGCSNLVSADLNGATTIVHGAFSGCEKLQTLVMKEVTVIENDTASSNGAFHNCASLVSVSLPKAEKIGKKSFNSCDSLSTVYAPQAQIIEEKAFAGCRQLVSLTLGETPPELGEDVFAKGKPEFIYVPSSSVTTYKNTDRTGWTDALKAKVRAQP